MHQLLHCPSTWSKCHCTQHVVFIFRGWVQATCHQRWNFAPCSSSCGYLWEPWQRSQINITLHCRLLPEVSGEIAFSLFFFIVVLKIPVLIFQFYFFGKVFCTFARFVALSNTTHTPLSLSAWQYHATCKWFLPLNSFSLALPSMSQDPLRSIWMEWLWRSDNLYFLFTFSQAVKLKCVL